MPRAALPLAPFLAAASLILGCAKAKNDRPKPADDGIEPQATKAPAKDTPKDEGKAPNDGPLHWIDDNYPAALAAAKEKGLPIVVDMWAPWCHTCLAMKREVLSSPGLANMADRFVWLAIDTDREKNASIQTTLPVNSWPTFYIVSSVDESVQARLIGAAPLSQFRDFLARGEGGHLDTAGKAGTADPILVALREGDRHDIYGRYDKAVAAYSKALELGGATWKRRPEALVLNLAALKDAGKVDDCLSLAEAHMDEMAKARTISTIDFAYHAKKCADKKSKEAGLAMRKRIAAPAGPLRSVLSDEQIEISVDDLAGAIGMLRDAEDALGNRDEAMILAERQRKLLDEEVAKIESTYFKMTYNWPRAEVYAYLGVAEELVPELEAQAKSLPTEYDPPHRLAWLYFQTGEYDHALERAGTALKLVYGPRKARIHSMIATIHHARGDKDAERAARKAEIATLEALPAGQEKPKSLARAKKALKAMDDA